MARLYCAFLVRCWQVGDGVQRIEVEHIQSGEKTVVASMAAALNWISARPCRDARASTPPDREMPTGGAEDA